MDYKEMIRILHDEDRGDVLDYVDEAADIIETLMTERDAAVEELRGICWCCANGKPMGMIGRLRSCTTCDYMAERGMLGVVGREKDCPHWQWRGPKKEGGA